MRKISIENFVGTRARFQRLSDAKLFTGWIESAEGNDLEVSTLTNSAVTPGDEFRIEGYGHKVSMTVTARLKEIGKLDLATEARICGIEGTTAKIVEAKRIRLKMVACAPTRFAATEESLRIKVPLFPVKTIQGGTTTEGYCVDIGPQGFGMVSTGRLCPGEPVTADIVTPNGVVSCAGEVRYSLEDRDREGMYRSGIEILSMERRMAPRWEMLLRGSN